MKLKDYFEKQRNIKTSEFQKMKIFEKFLDKSQKVSLYRRINFYYKVAAYFVFIMLLIFSFYGPFINTGVKINQKNNGKEISEVYTGFLVEKEIKNPNIVFANYIGKIIEAKGDIVISKDGQKFKSDRIQDGATILLVNSAEIKFEVNSGTTAIIKGPAEFQVSFVGEESGVKNYLINLINGDYFEVFSNEKPKDNLIIKTEKFEIESQFVEEKLNLKITSDGNKQIVENKGSAVVVKKVVNNKKTFSAIGTNQKAEIDKEIKILEEIKKISKEVQNKEIVQTYTITGTQDNTGNQASIDYKDLIGDSRQIVSPEQSKELKQLLHATFVKKDIENLVKSYLEGNKTGFEISYKNIYSKLDKLYDLFEFSFDSELTKYKLDKGLYKLDDLANNLDQLISKINRTYYISPQYMKRLKNQLAWILILNERNFGEFQKQEIDFKQIFEILKIKDLKDNLIIN